MDALQILMNDHDQVNQLFQKFESGGNSQDFQQLFTQLDRELTIHTEIEEKIFYPAVRNFPDTSALIEEAYQEHGQAKQLLTELAGLDNTTAEWGQKMTQLMRAIQEHVSEEEGDLFPRLRQEMSAQQLEQLGQQLTEAKHAAQGSMAQPGQNKMIYDNNMGQQPSL